jgi:cation diffusion facilitator CzcD-associated flavoprotein CzcO
MFPVRTNYWTGCPKSCLHVPLRVERECCRLDALDTTLIASLQPDWPRFFSYSQDIFDYLAKVCDCFGLRKYMTFNTEVIGCYWQQEKGEWLVKLSQTAPDGSIKQFDDTCNLLLYGTGILNNYKWPEIEGMDKFKGRVWNLPPSSCPTLADNLADHPHRSLAQRLPS